MAKNPPTVRMRRLGAQLRKIRQDRGLTLDEAADLLKLSKSALNRMENAQVVVRRHEVEYFVMKYEVTDDDLSQALLGLAAAGRSRDWIKRHGSLAPGPVVGEFVRLEQDSVAVRTFQPIVIPGLLQTPEYARAVIESGPADPVRDVERWVAYRMARQEVLTREHPARLDAVVGEAALRQRLGGADVMHGQLRHVLEATRRPNVAVLVLPYEAVRHPGADGPFTLLDVEMGNFTVAVVESLTRNMYIEDETEITRYTMTFDDLCAESLSEAESQALIQRILQEQHDRMAEEQP